MDNDTYYLLFDDYIIVGTILPDTIINNSRTDIKDKSMAMYRLSSLKINDMYHKISKEHINHIGNSRYKINKILIDVNYDKQLENSRTVCIEYINNTCHHRTNIYGYLTEDAAYYSNFKICTDQLEYYANGRQMIGYTGLFRYYHDNGNLIFRCNCIDGKLHGEANTFYSDGLVKCTCNYTNGLANGSYHSYFSRDRYMHEPINQRIENEFNYVNGERDGIQKIFHTNGTLHNIYVCENGKLNGIYKTYERNGQIYEIKYYKNDIQCGKHIKYKCDPIYSDQTCVDECNLNDQGVIDQ
jgi:antitoxin component YwqK of YwqJK toxin-antitoxin module